MENMIAFTIYNPITKRIAEEKFFDSLSSANAYCKEKYSEGYIAKHEPFHFSSDFHQMLMTGIDSRIKKNKNRKATAIISDDGQCILHCGEINLQEWVNISAAGLRSTQISKVEFINLHNSIIREKELRSAESFNV